MKYLIYFSILFLLLFLFQRLNTQVSKNSCIECHKKQPSKSVAFKCYQIWEMSYHAKMGVTCEKCHHGNPQSNNIKEAHSDIFKKTDVMSSVHRSSIVSTCGFCHDEIKKSFKKSKHYNPEISQSEIMKYPVCTDCHGLLGGEVFQVGTINKTCGGCHKLDDETTKHIFTKLIKAWGLLDDSRSILSSAIEKYDKIKEKPDNVEEVKKSAEFSLNSAIETWHTFYPESSINKAEEALSVINKFNNLLKTE